MFGLVKRFRDQALSIWQEVAVGFTLQGLRFEAQGLEHSATLNPMKRVMDHCKEFGQKP